MIKYHRGFSLVELSIVLVILGLLTGGILSGQSLIRAAELRAIVSEVQHYQTAAHTFRDKYFAIPGDMQQASRFWGYNQTAANCPNRTGAANAGATGVCDGNGDGDLDALETGGQANERLQFWTHLAKAGLIEGTYTGVAGPNAHSHVYLGENVPKSRISNVGWWATDYRNEGAGGFSLPHGATGRTLVVAALTSGTTTQVTAAFLTPTEMWNIDTKMDDGKPAQGKIMARNYMTCTSYTSDTDTAAEYLLASSTKGCAIHANDAY